MSGFFENKRIVVTGGAGFLVGIYTYCFGRLAL